MDLSGVAASLGVVHVVTGCVKGIANHDATKRFFTEFPTQLIGHFGEDGAPEDAELGCVWHRRRKENERNAISEPNRAVVRAVAEVHSAVLTAHDHMEFGTAMLWSIA
jgi:hypothetical protein